MAAVQRKAPASRPIRPRERDRGQDMKGSLQDMGWDRGVIGTRGTPILDHWWSRREVRSVLRLGFPRQKRKFAQALTPVLWVTAHSGQTRPNGLADMANILKSPCDEGTIRCRATGAAARASGPWILAATILGSSMAFIDGTVVNVALPALQASFDATVADVQWVVEAYALFLAALLLVGGSLGDRFGRRRVFASASVLFALASVWCGLAPDLTQLDPRARASRAWAAPCWCRAASRSSAPRSSERARARDRHLVGLHRDHGGDRPGPRRLADRAGLLALGVLRSTCRSRSPCS